MQRIVSPRSSINSGNFELLLQGATISKQVAEQLNFFSLSFLVYRYSTRTKVRESSAYITKHSKQHLLHIVQEVRTLQQRDPEAGGGGHNPRVRINT